MPTVFNCRCLQKNSLGKKHGFECDRQGNLFFKICEIISAKRPPIVILENVKNLKSHDKRRTWPVIKSNLEELGTASSIKLLMLETMFPSTGNGSSSCVLTKKSSARIRRMSSRTSHGHNCLRDILEPDPDPKYTLTAFGNISATMPKSIEKLAMVLDMASRTLMASRGRSVRGTTKMDQKRIPRGARERPRRLTVVEAARLMGFGSKVKSVKTSRYQTPVLTSSLEMQSCRPLVVEAVACGRGCQRQC